MEQFAVQHAGDLLVKHSLTINPSPAFAQSLTELRKIVTVIAVAWVSVTLVRSLVSYHHRPT